MRLLLLIILSALSIGCDRTMDSPPTEVIIFPQPQQLSIEKGSFLFGKDLTIHHAPRFENAVKWFEEFLAEGPGWKLSTSKDTKADLKIRVDTALTDEGYRLRITEDDILVEANTDAGAFYGLQTLRQLLPVDWEKQHTIPREDVMLPTLFIEDTPTFSYRGMHLDVSRHFFPKETIKEYLSYLALLKMNTFHWHLTDDQGWRIEIKKYPKLTSHGEFRNETLVGHYNDMPRTYDGTRYGGFYTQEDIKEIVAYAKSLKITVIPEIEMPGHAQAAVSSYPELGCTGNSVPVATEWGIFENVFCTKPQTIAFLKDVLLEVMPLFPGNYIHIGGDEAPKTHWKACEDCQFRMLKDRITSEEALQSWFITEIEEFVNQHGKQIIGWDEILEGGLAPNATVMSWRGIEGGMAAAEANHKVVMTPTSHLYFDYYQDTHPEEPLAIGGYVPLKKVYGFSPIPEALEPGAHEYILGAQGNVWTEYMPTFEQVEYMIFPRMIAISEVLWTGPRENLAQDYSKFLERWSGFQKRLDAKNVSYYDPLHQLEVGFQAKRDTLFATVTTPLPNATVRYEYNGSQQTYSKSVPIVTSGTFKAQMMEGNETVGHPYTTEIKIHRGIAADISLDRPPHPAYNAGGVNALHNGVLGSNDRFGDGEWLGFWGDDLSISAEWETPVSISTLETRFFEAIGQWVYAPKEASITWETAEGTTETVTLPILASNEASAQKHLKWKPTIPKQNITKITLHIPSFGIIPEGTQGAGNPAWTFIDELVIE